MFTVLINSFKHAKARNQIKPNLAANASENVIVEQFGVRGHVRAFKAATRRRSPNGQFALSFNTNR